jgi:hypothetical protein
LARDRDLAMLVVKRHFTTPMRKVVLEKTALCLAGLESEDEESDS